MSKEISKNLICISLMSGKEIWIEKDRLPALEDALKNSQFINIDGNLVNKSIIEGSFKPDIMEDSTRRKNGEWKCQYNVWHKKFQECDCGRKTETILPKIEKSNNDHESNMETLRQAMLKNKNCV